MSEEINISIYTVNKKTIEIEGLSENSTVNDICKKIQEQEEIPPDQIYLYQDGSGEMKKEIDEGSIFVAISNLNSREKLKIRKRLLDYDIKSGDLLIMNRKQDNIQKDDTLFVKTMSGKSMTFVQDGITDITLGQFKQDIVDRNEIDVLQTIDDVRLLFAGKMLKNNEKKLGEYNIKEGDVLHLVLKRKKVNDDQDNVGNDDRGGCCTIL